jgi:hypothetical protein
LFTLDSVSSCADGRAALALTEFDALVLDPGLANRRFIAGVRTVLGFAGARTGTSHVGPR